MKTTSPFDCGVVDGAAQVGQETEQTPERLDSLRARLGVRRDRLHEADILGEDLSEPVRVGRTPPAREPLDELLHR